MEYIKEIQRLRKEIDNIDNSIFRLIKRRFAVSKKIGEKKRSSGLNIKDGKRETKIVNDKIDRFKINPGFVRNFYRLIFIESRRLQK